MEKGGLIFTYFYIFAPLFVDFLLRKTGELRFLINYRGAIVWKIK